MGLSPGRALVPHARATTPAIDDASAKGRTVTTRSASICGVGDTNAGNDGEKSRDQKCSHPISPVSPILAQPDAMPAAA
jgi:hypothetical protein